MATPSASDRACEADPPGAVGKGVAAVYFNCEAAAPGELRPVYRRVEEGGAATDRALLDAAMHGLVAGPTPEEQGRGFVSFFSDAAGIEVLDTRLSENGDTPG